MEITFTNIDGNWVAEFEVTGNFNIHIERETEGRLDIYQRTAGAKFDLVYDTGYLNRRTVYDYDFEGSVYSKTIKIVSAVNPTVAVVTMASSGSEGGSDDTDTDTSGPIEYHFDIPMEYTDMFIGGGYTGTIEGDFSDFLNKVSALCDANGGTVSEEIWAEKANVTVNQYRVTGAPYGMNSDGSCELSTNAPEAMGGGNILGVYPTSAYYEHGA